MKFSSSSWDFDVRQSSCLRGLSNIEYPQSERSVASLGEGADEGEGGPSRVTSSRGWHPNEIYFFVVELTKKTG